MHENKRLPPIDKMIRTAYALMLLSKLLFVIVLPNKQLIQIRNAANTQLKDDMLYLKCRSMRDNLIFTNIPEQQNIDTERTFLIHS